MFSFRIILFRTIALLLAMSVGLASASSASATHTSHCVPSTERVGVQHEKSTKEVAAETLLHAVSQPDNANADGADCEPHFCSAVLIGLVSFGTVSHMAALLNTPEPANLLALSRTQGLYRPPSL